MYPPSTTALEADAVWRDNHEPCLTPDRMLTADGYDDCVIGIAHRFGMEPVVAYDLGKVIQQLMKEGMDREEAQEWFEFNIIGAWVGEETPIFVDKGDLAYVQEIMQMRDELNGEDPGS